MIDCLGESADLIVRAHFHLSAIASGRNSVRKICESFDGIGDMTPEPKQQRDHGEGGEYDHSAGHDIAPPCDPPYADE